MRFQLLRRHHLFILCILAVLLPAPAHADHEDSIYTQKTISQWARPVYDVIIVPPAHGQIYNLETGVLRGGDPNELTPSNSYLPAMEAAVEAWDDAVQMFGTNSLKEAFVTNTYVLGRDAIPQSVLTDTEILVVTDEQHYGAGTAYRTPDCIVRVSKINVLSLTYSDMYNVTMHEFGHCIGLGHMGDEDPDDPLAGEDHPHDDVMSGYYGYNTGFAGNPLKCISNLNIYGLEWVFRTPVQATSTIGSKSGLVEMAVAHHGTTCDPPAPGEGPPPYPEPTEPPVPTFHDRGIDMELRKHLTAIGKVKVSDGYELCVSEIGFQIERKQDGKWGTVKEGATDDEGGFRARLPDRVGRYRAIVGELTLDAEDVCRAAKSSSVRHSH